jgi:Ca2+-binding RTX toxin-like protein
MPADVVRAGDDYVGTEGDDVVLVLGPPSEVHAHGGDDLVCVHGSHSQPDWATTVHAGEGDDVVWGLSGALFAWGNDGDDVLLGNGTSMTFGGDDGNDVVNAAGAASAWVHGGTGHDWVTGSPGADEVWGGEGNDRVFGWDGADSIDGEFGNDELYGGHGPDELDGGPDTDDCHDYASATEGATLTSCEFPHLVPVTPDDIAFG